MYQQTQNAGKVCRRCGISRPTLRKWVRRYEELNIKGLVAQSRRPFNVSAFQGVGTTKTVDFRIKANATIRSETAAFRNSRDCMVCLCLRQPSIKS